MGYIRNEFARIVGISPIMYAHYENGTHSLEVDTVEKIANAIGCKAADLVAPADSNYVADKGHGAERYDLKTEPIKCYTGGNLVFCNKLGVSYRASNLRANFREMIKKAEISGIHIHSLRHTFATRGLEQGIPLKVMQELLGHATLQMTADLYTHVLPETKHSEMSKMANAIKF